MVADFFGGGDSVKRIEGFLAIGTVQNQGVLLGIADVCIERDPP